MQSDRWLSGSAIAAFSMDEPVAVIHLRARLRRSSNHEMPFTFEGCCYDLLGVDVDSWQKTRGFTDSSYLGYS